MDYLTHSIATADGARLAVRECGAGTPILALHGIPEDHTSFARLAPLLAHRARLILPDLRGFGDSAPPDGLSVDPSALAKDIGAVVEALELRDPILLGHDLGGYAAIDYVQRRLGPARALLLLNTTYKKVYLSGSPHMLFFCLPLLGRALIHLAGPRLADFAFRMGFADPAKADPAQLQHCRELCQSSSQARAIADCYAAFGKSAVTKRWHPELKPRPVDIPGLLLWGERDFFLDARLQGWLGRLLPGLRIVPFAAAGHFPHQEAPEAVAATILEFLEHLAALPYR
ncbi:MAG: alpha/beta hydrolase [Candidatus Wallbacteria bacterium]|nr:alpha/beta hydrolase [Candidatus Wallbacteria bacterium]